MELFEVPWSSGLMNGKVPIWAPDAVSARFTVAAHPSRFGIPHADPIVGRARAIPFVEITLDA